MSNTSQLFKDDEQEQAGRVSDDELNKITSISPEQEAGLQENAENGSIFDSDGDDSGGSEYASGSNPASPAMLKARESNPTKPKNDGVTSQASEPMTAQSFLKNGMLGANGGSSPKIMGLDRKKALFLGAGGTVGLIAFLVVLLIIASSLKIPNLTQNIAALEFTRVTRQFSESASRVTGETLAKDAVVDTTEKNVLLQKYADAKGKVSDTWSKLDKYRPEKTIQNMGKTNGLQLKFDSKGTFTGGTLDGVKFDVTAQGKTKFVPGLNNLIEFKKNVQFARDFTPALDNALRANEIGPVVRAAVDNNIRQKLGIGLVAWNLGKFQGKGDRAALIEETRQKYSRVNNSLVDDPAKTSNISDAEEKAKTATTEALADDAKVQETIDNGGIVKKAAQAMNDSLAGSGLKTALGVINPIYAAGMPICIVYDGSLQKSGPTIDNNVREQQAGFFYVASGGSQQGFGTPINDQSTSLAAAVGALNTDLGDTTTTNAYIQMSGGTVNTSNMPSAEASAGGEFTLINALPGMNQSLANTLNNLGDRLCPIFTDTKGAVAIGAANIILAIGTLGSSSAAEATVEGTTQVIVKEEAANLAERIVARIIQKDASAVAGSNFSRAGKFVYGTTKDAVKNAVAVAGVTVLAKLIVSNKAAMMNGGFTQGTDLANMAQSGANIHANEIERIQLFGAPLMQADQIQNDKADATVIAAAQSNESFVTRYVSVKNPTSMLARMAIAISGQKHMKTVGSLLKLGSSILRPSAIASIFKPLVFGKAQAAANNTHYGNVQFGWTAAETAKMNSSDSYYMLENQRILDASGKEAEIANKYANCFGYTADSDGNLTLANGSGEPGSLGTLLSEGKIMRDADGNVINTDNPDDCSPRNLSFTNAQYGDLVFRWRLAHKYDTTADQLISEQDVQT